MNNESATNASDVVTPKSRAAAGQNRGGFHQASLARARAMATQSRTHFEIRFAMAHRMPRSWKKVRRKLLEECKRPSFAEVATYFKPVDGGIVGPSIRFAEAAARCMGNLLPDTQVLYDDLDKAVVRVSVTDLEVNLTYAVEDAILKTVERMYTEGRDVLGERRNAENKSVFTVRATEDEMRAKQGAWVSRTLRSCILRFVPGDLLEACMEQVDATREEQAARDLDAARAKLAEDFAALGVWSAQLEAYLGHDVAHCTAAELVELRCVWTALRDGECKWKDAERFKRIERGADRAPNRMGKGLKALKERLAASSAPDAPEATEGRPPESVSSAAAKFPRKGLHEDSGIEFTEWVQAPGGFRGEWKGEGKYKGTLTIKEDGEIVVFTPMDAPLRQLEEAVAWAIEPLLTNP